MGNAGVLATWNSPPQKPQKDFLLHSLLAPTSYLERTKRPCLFCKYWLGRGKENDRHKSQQSPLERLSEQMRENQSWQREQSEVFWFSRKDGSAAIRMDGDAYGGVPQQAKR